MKRILIVEDDPMVADVIGDIVATLGFESMWASSGVDVFDRLEEMEFDLVIMDLELPAMNGFDVACRLKRMDPGVRILFSTGYSDTIDLIDLSDPSYCGIIRKPFDLAGIQTAIEKALART